ncbi:hypothetical protein E3N88_15847 [Mikania micrantha]|uniref:Integrase catalytic domain-containing protein n=1 Tax=Mikania micrantha TaxID=192012 RepID=A0A5N6NXX9_9ASTR|nr:hypothetical protein E3N88_15847 [Mikania micrantha]
MRKQGTTFQQEWIPSWYQEIHRSFAGPTTDSCFSRCSSSSHPRRLLLLLQSTAISDQRSIDVLIRPNPKITIRSSLLPIQSRCQPSPLMLLFLMASLHPATTVTNIKNFIPITLEMENAQYTSWSELFQIHCTAFQVLDHIFPPAPPQPIATAAEKEPATPPVDPVLWSRLDAIVKQWIYGTISNDLLHTILKPKSTAAEAWQALANIFQDNKTSRALHLQSRFSNVKLDSFPNASAYCQQLKVLSDQLANVDAPVSDQQLVLQLIKSKLDGVGMMLQQTHPLPDFYVARSRLILEETRQAQQTPPETALHAAASRTATGSAAPVDLNPLPPTYSYSDTTRGQSRGRGRVGRGRGRGRRINTNTRSASGSHGHSSFMLPPWMQQYPQWWSPQPWSVPPVPYPTMPSPRGPPSRGNNAGILGPPPSQFYAASEASSIPTNIEQAMHTMTLNPDQNWYLDTGATNHMSHSTGSLSHYLNNSVHNSIVVGNGYQIPITGTGSTTLPPPFPPLHLNKILVAPHLIKNLLSVRRLTTDNKISIEFDPFGFLVKDYQTRIPILRCDSTGDLYPLTTSTAKVNSPSTFAALSQDLWHYRLGHPGSSLLNVLKKQNVLSFPSHSRKHLCQSCVFGKLTKLPFDDSTSCTYLPFDIVHSDLWTSPTQSSGGHRYYILFLDDYTNYLWTFPLANKSVVFSIFRQFHSVIKTQFERGIKTFQCDNGTEYNNKAFHDFCTQNGMLFRFSCPHTSSQNGKAERKIRSINNIIRTLLTYASLPPTFWHHALQMATYLLNILPSKTKHNQTPTYLLFHKHPSYNHLRTFGCLCYPLIPSTSINKLQSRSSPCVFLGYPSNHRGYKCFDLSTRKIVISRHVVFDETVFPFSKRHSSPPNYEFLHSNLSSDPHPSFWFGHSVSTIPPTPPPTSDQTNCPLVQPQQPTAQPQPALNQPTSPTTEGQVRTRISGSSGNCSSIQILTSSSNSFSFSFFFLANERPRTFLYPRCDAYTFPPNLLECIQSPSPRLKPPNKPPIDVGEEEIEAEYGMLLNRKEESREGTDGNFDEAVGDGELTDRKMTPAAAMEETSEEGWRLRRKLGIGGRRDLIRAGDG